MNLIILAASLFVGVDAGGLLLQEASLRRTVAPSVEVHVGARPLPIMDIRLGYGWAPRTEGFSGLSSKVTYHRFPLRIDGRHHLGKTSLSAGAGPVLLATRTRLDAAGDAVDETAWTLGALLGVGIEAPVLELPGRGSIRLRANTDVYFRGQRTDVGLTVGASWSFD